MHKCRREYTENAEVVVMQARDALSFLVDFQSFHLTAVYIEIDERNAYLDHDGVPCEMPLVVER